MSPRCARGGGLDGDVAPVGVVMSLACLIVKLILCTLVFTGVIVYGVLSVPPPIHVLDRP